MADMLSLDKFCGDSTLGGLRCLAITPIDNVNRLPKLGVVCDVPPIKDPQRIYYLWFKKERARFQERSNDSRSGQFYSFQITAQFQGPNVEMEKLINLLKNRCINGFYNDCNRFRLWFWNASFNHTYDTGQRKADKNLYTITITGQHCRENVYLEKDVPCCPPISDDDMCCPTINAVPLSYTPSPTGNTTNLSEFVTGSDGCKYYIDADGNACKLGGNPVTANTQSFQYNAYSGDEITLPPGCIPDPSGLSDEQITSLVCVYRQGVRVNYDPTVPQGQTSNAAADIFSIDYANNKILFPYALEDCDVFITITKP